MRAPPAPLPRPFSRAAVRVALTALLALLFLSLARAPAMAEERPRVQLFDDLLRAEPGQPQAKPEQRAWKLTADALQDDMAARVVEATGNALARSGDDFMRADFARYYQLSNWLYLRGNVRMQWEGRALEAEEAEVDLVNKVGWLKHGRIITDQPRVFIAGERIDKVGERTYTFKEATVTACETGEGNREPAWSLAMDRAEVTAEDVADLYNPRLRIEGVPSLWLPYLAFSTRSKRTSGFLYPEMGYSSKLGYYAMLPYYWAVNNEHDLTFYEYALSSRGFMQGLQWRAAPDAMSRLDARIDWLHDSQAAGTEAEEPSRFQGDGLARPNRNRYWLRSKYDGRLDDPRWLVKLDTDYVSDQNYLREITVGEAGFNDSRNSFLNRFGRDIAVKDSLTRQSTALTTRDFEDLGVSAKAAYTQNLAYMNDNLPRSTDPTVQRLPELRAFAWKDRLAATPLEYEADAEAVHLWRRYGSTARRLDLHPSLSLPMAGRYLSVIPGGGFRQTLYSMDRRPDEDARILGQSGGQPGDGFASRGLPEASLTAASEFFRVFELGQAPQAGLENVGQSAWTRLKHTLQPRLDYLWQDDGSRRNLPRLDPLDSLEGVNQLRYSLTSILDRKRAGVQLVPQPGNSYQPAAVTDYLEFLRLRVEQSYDVREAHRDDQLDRFERRPFSDVLLDAGFNPLPWLGLTSRTSVSPYSGNVAEHEHYLNLTLPERGDLFFGLDFVNEPESYARRLEQEVNTVVVGGRLRLDNFWTVSARLEHDYERNREVETQLGLTYSHHCYDLIFSYQKTPYDTAFMIKFNLLGLASPAIQF